MFSLHHKFRKSSALVFLIALSACVSTPLDNNLGTQVFGQGNQLTFSWEVDHPFATNYQRDPITVVAEYIEVDQAGLERKVRQYLTPNRGRVTTASASPNSRNFQLLTQLPSPPKSDAPICLYLESGNAVIPIRDATQGETARFRFPAWEQEIKRNTVNRFAQRDLSAARNNVAVLSSQLETQKQQQRIDLADFNHQLRNEPLQANLVINSPSQCPLIELTVASDQRPFDVIDLANIPTAATEVCVRRTFNGLDQGPGAVFVLLMAYTTMLDEAPNFTLDDIASSRTNDFIAFLRAFDSHKERALGDDYQPPLGTSKDYIRLSSHAVSLQTEAGLLLTKGESLSEPNKQLVNQVLAAELDVYNSCVVEGQQQLITKLDAWHKQQEAQPQRLIARQAFLEQQCLSMFENASREVSRLEQALSQAKRELEQLEAFYAGIQSTETPNVSQTNLNALACQL